MEWAAFGFAVILSGLSVLVALGAAFSAGQLDAIQASKGKIDRQGSIIVGAMVFAAIFMGAGVAIVVS